MADDYIEHLPTLADLDPETARAIAEMDARVMDWSDPPPLTRFRLLPIGFPVIRQMTPAERTLRESVRQSIIHGEPA